MRSARRPSRSGVIAVGRAVALTSLLLVAGCGSAPVDQASGRVSALGLPSRLYGLSMSTARAGWAFTSTALFHTANGGVSWKDVTPRDRGGTTLSATTVDFVDGDIAFVAPRPLRPVPAALYRSVDAGGHWRQVGTVPDATAQIDFASAEVGWSVIDEPSPTGSANFLLERTLDGGKTWSVVYSNTNQGGGAGDLGAVTFATAERGWMTGIDNANGLVFLRVTHDGGKRWHSQRLPRPPGVTLAQWGEDQIEVDAPQLFGPQRREALLPVWVGERLEIYHSDDGGLHWMALHIPSSAPAGPGLDKAGADFVNARYGWAWSSGPPTSAQPGAVETTTNGGRTWQRRATHHRISQVIEIDFATVRVGWLLEAGTDDGSYKVLQSVDGGVKWKVP